MFTFRSYLPWLPWLPWLLWLLSIPGLALGDDSEVPEPQKDAVWAENLWQSLQQQTGKISLPEAQVNLDLSNEFYFLKAADAQKVLLEVWNTPPAEPILGMIIPAAKTPFDKDVWAVTLRYVEDGHVSDVGIAEADYAGMLQDMQEQLERDNKARVTEGHEPIKLIGWVAPPAYDAAQHKLYWAKEIQFGDEPLHTLNYHIRVLGRKGVMALDFIADIEQLPVIESQLANVLAMVNFAPGAGYQDFDSTHDTRAAYGIAALVTGNMRAKLGPIGHPSGWLGLLALSLVMVAGIGWYAVAGRKRVATL